MRTCKFKRSKVAVKIKDLYYATYGKESVAMGPVPANVDSRKFKNYARGIFDEKCNENIDHAVTVVGWGVEDLTRIEYWIIRNSWG